MSTARCLILATLGATLVAIGVLPSSVAAQSADGPAPVSDDAATTDDAASDAETDDAATDDAATDDAATDDAATDDAATDASFDDASTDAATSGVPIDEGMDLDDMGDLEALLGESVVTTASRSAEVASAAPSTVFTITSRELWTYGIRRIDEALAFLGIGMVGNPIRDDDSGGDLGANGIMLRDRGRHVLLLVDGHVMNSQGSGDAYFHEAAGVPLTAIDHLEVMLGAGSVMYGSNAMLAVVNVVTRRAAGYHGIHVTTEAMIAPPMDEQGMAEAPTGADRVGLRYRLGLGAATEFDALGTHGELVIHAEWLENIGNSIRTPQLQFGELRPGETSYGGTMTPSMTAPSVVGTLRFGDFRLSVMANRYTNSLPLTGLFNDPRAREIREALRADLSHSVSISNEVSLSSRVYADTTGWSEANLWTSPIWCPPGQIDGCRYERRGVGRWLGLEQQLAIDWNVDGNIVSTVGYDLRMRDSTGRTGDYTDLQTGALPYTTRLPYFSQLSFLGAVFAQQVWRPFEWLGFNAGARLDLDSNFGARVSPRFAATVNPFEGATIRASYSEAFRAPTPYELNEIDPTYRAQAGTLRPEIVRAGELEWQQRLGWATFGVRGFVSFYEDFISTRVVTPQEFAQAAGNGDLAGSADGQYVVRWDNLRSMRAFGGSLSFLLRPVTGLSLGGSLTVVDARLGEEPVTLMPTWYGNARVAYELSPDGAAFALTAAFQGRRRAWASADLATGVPPEVGETVDLRLTVSSPIDPIPGLSFRASLGYVVNPQMPYIVQGPTADQPNLPLYFRTVPSQVTGMLGLQLTLDP